MLQWGMTAAAACRTRRTQTPGTTCPPRVESVCVQPKKSNGSILPSTSAQAAIHSTATGAPDSVKIRRGRLQGKSAGRAAALFVGGGAFTADPSAASRSASFRLATTAAKGCRNARSIQLCAAALVHGILSCSPPSRVDELLHARLPSGTPLATLAGGAPTDTIVLLVYDPADCLACGAPIGIWRDWAGSNGHRQVRLVLSRPPSHHEATVFRIARATPAGVLSGGQSRIQTPSILIVGPSGVLDSAFGRHESGQLFDRWVLSGSKHRPGARQNDSWTAKHD